MSKHLAELIHTFVQAQGGQWSGTSTELLSQLQPHLKHSDISHKLIQSSSVLARAIKKHRKPLATAGIIFSTSRTGRRRTLTLTVAASEEPTPSKLLDWLDDAANYLVDRATRARIMFCRRERARLKAEAEEEKEKKITAGCVIHGRPGRERPWDDGGIWFHGH